ncbi:hypothetical protein ACFCZ1_01495 [Streptomyces sp. NPDC056224]|uniref:hypothetical protein n=1 Tax=Streptomyces sp. NPDC056224 TaxID=3345750 RepID=UPI0035E23192
MRQSSSRAAEQPAVEHPAPGGRFGQVVGRPLREAVAGRQDRPQRVLRKRDPAERGTPVRPHGRRPSKWWAGASSAAPARTVCTAAPGSLSGTAGSTSGRAATHRDSASGSRRRPPLVKVATVRRGWGAGPGFGLPRRVADRLPGAIAGCGALERVAAADLRRAPGGATLAPELLRGCARATRARTGGDAR